MADLDMVSNSAPISDCISPSVTRRSKRLRACPSACPCCCLQENVSDVSAPSGKKKKQRSLVDIYRSDKLDSKSADFLDDIVCQICDRGDGEESMLICDGCNLGYHMYCMCPIMVSVPKGEWHCRNCSKKDTVLAFPLVQKKIIDFFRIQRPIESSPGIKRRRRHSGGLSMHKRNRKLIPYTPTKDPDEKLRQMASLATALINSGVDFSDELTYMDGFAPRSANSALLEKGGMQAISRDDKATYDLCKAMCLRGDWPPLMVTHDSRQGFVVEASSHIKDMTLIAEYTGDVDFMHNRLHDEGDSIMGLLFTADPRQELVICPDKRGNVARFVSGINNHTREGKRKQNLRCVRFNIDGEAHALLVAIRDISKGERLYYDYNGLEKEYPTEHFV